MSTKRSILDEDAALYDEALNTKIDLTQLEHELAAHADSMAALVRAYKAALKAEKAAEHDYDVMRAEVIQANRGAVRGQTESMLKYEAECDTRVKAKRQAYDKAATDFEGVKLLWKVRAERGEMLRSLTFLRQREYQAAGVSNLREAQRKRYIAPEER